MNEATAAKTLSALGNVKRLAVFRLLVRAGRGGLSIGDIQMHLSVPASTLAHHIAALVNAGLVRQDKQGREVICTAEYETMESVFAFMTEHCCAGVTPLADAG